MAQKKTAAQKRQLIEAMRDAIQNSAQFNAEFMRDCFDGKVKKEEGEDDDHVVVATARIVSTLVAMREWAHLHGPLDHNTIQVAITAWMDGAGCDTIPTPMGGEKYIRKGAKK